MIHWIIFSYAWQQKQTAQNSFHAALLYTPKIIYPLCYVITNHNLNSNATFYLENYTSFFGFRPQHFVSVQNPVTSHFGWK